MTNNEVKRVQPESFRAREMTASLTVKDLQKSLAWYRDIVGFTVDREIERDGKLRAVAVRAGTVRILLNQDDGAKGMDRVKGEPSSLQLITTQSVDDIARHIKDFGGSLDTEPADMPWGARVFRVRDPDGFKFAISTERSAS
jgi:lactoylglutathione lyase